MMRSRRFRSGFSAASTLCSNPSVDAEGVSDATDLADGVIFNALLEGTQSRFSPANGQFGVAKTFTIGGCQTDLFWRLCSADGAKQRNGGTSGIARSGRALKATPPSATDTVRKDLTPVSKILTRQLPPTRNKLLDAHIAVAILLIEDGGFSALGSCVRRSAPIALHFHAGRLPLG
jgi:hypothetical protein